MPMNFGGKRKQFRLYSAQCQFSQPFDRNSPLRAFLLKAGVRIGMGHAKAYVTTMTDTNLNILQILSPHHREMKYPHIHPDRTEAIDARQTAYGFFRA
jgi:hypothetical protein